MYYYYYKRGKCLQCNQLLWTENNQVGVQCSCTFAHIIKEEEVNIAPVTDEEHIIAIKQDLNIEEEITLIKI